MKKTKAFTLILTGLVITGLCSCASNDLKHAELMGHSNHDHQEYKFALKDNAISQPSKDGKYIVSLYSNESPIPLRRIHTWTLHVEKNDGSPLENAKIYVFGGMPMHNHDFPTVPTINQYLGHGDYLVEGVKFSMKGHWEMRFTIKQNRQEDRVIFGIHL